MSPSKLKLPIFTLVLVALLPLTPLRAGILKITPGKALIEGVRLAESGTLESNGKNFTLKRYVTGLRKKKIAIFWANVYVGQILSTPGLDSPPSTIIEGLETLSKQPVVAISMSFLRDVTVQRMKDAFKESLEANGINPEEDDMKPLFKVVENSGGMIDQRTTTIILERDSDGKESFRFENGLGEIQSSAVKKGTLKKILTLWFGKPADSGVERMQNQFLGLED